MDRLCHDGAVVHDYVCQHAMTGASHGGGVEILVSDHVILTDDDSNQNDGLYHVIPTYGDANHHRDRVPIGSGGR